MKILHLITGLGVGGAEMSLARLAPRLREAGVRQQVVSVLEAGPLAAQIRQSGVEVRSLGVSRSVSTPAGLWRLVRLMREFSPDVVQTWLYHADILGLVAAPFAGRPPVVWNIRCADMDLSRYSRMTSWTRSACVRLSTRPAAVVVNSRRAQEYHEGLGYRPRRFECIPNGFDTDVFSPESARRDAMRQEVGADDGTVLVGMAARFDPMKGHEVFAAAAGAAARRDARLRFVLCGTGMDAENDLLMRMLDDAEVGGKVCLLGRRDDMPTFFSGLDVAVLSSHTESFPNAVAEAMACGVPCAVTDVGDAAEVVGEAGRVAPSRDAAALADAICELAALPSADRVILGRAARERIRQRYSLGVMTERYLSLYRDIAG